VKTSRHVIIVGNQEHIIEYSCYDGCDYAVFRQLEALGLEYLDRAERDGRILSISPPCDFHLSSQPRRLPSLEGGETRNEDDTVELRVV
jgi:hypothetical protein